MIFFNELKRRNVFKVAIAYIVTSWLVAQVAQLAAESFGAPEWVMKMFITLLALGFPIAIIFAWAFEVTPEGIKKEKDVDRSQSITNTTGQKLNYTIIGLLVLALGYFAYDKFVVTSGQITTSTATTRSGTEADQAPSIAVLPFVNMSDDASNEYFSDGLSEELLNLLAKIPELKVAARTSSFYFKGKTGDVADIGKQLKVAHVLEGSVRKSGNQVRITAQLIKTDDGYHLWSETYDRQLDNIFQIQDEIAGAVVDALKITLLGEAPKSKETNPEAYRLYLEGQYYYRKGNINSIGKSIDLMKQALAIDPGYAPAWTDLARVYMWYTGLGGMPIDKGNVLADEAIEKALAIDPDYAMAYTMRSFSRVYNKFNFSKGLKDANHAMKLDPASTEAMAMISDTNRAFGRFEQAIKYSLAAIELDPVQPALYETLGSSYYFAGDQEKAEATFRKLLALSPEYTSAHYRLGRVLLKKGETAEALHEMEIATDNVYGPTGQAMVYHTLGNAQKSDEALAYMIKQQAAHAAFQIAEIYGFRGEVDKALEWLNQSLEIHDAGLQSTLGNPAFQSLLSDPRWEQFLDKLGLAEAWHEMPPETGGPLQ